MGFHYFTTNYVSYFTQHNDPIHNIISYLTLGVSYFTIPVMVALRQVLNSVQHEVRNFTTFTSYQIAFINPDNDTIIFLQHIIGKNMGLQYSHNKSVKKSHHKTVVKYETFGVT